MMHLTLVILLLTRALLQTPAPTPAPAPAPAPQSFSNCKVTMTATQVTIVCPLPPPPLVLTNPQLTLPDAKVGVPYLVSLPALALPTGGLPPYTYAAKTGFPPWLTLSPAGTLLGIPDASGTLNLTYEVTDSSGGTARATPSTALTIVAAR